MQCLCRYTPTRALQTPSTTQTFRRTDRASSSPQPHLLQELLSSILQLHCMNTQQNHACPNHQRKQAPCDQSPVRALTLIALQCVVGFVIEVHLFTFPAYGSRPNFLIRHSTSSGCMICSRCLCHISVNFSPSACAS